MNITRMSNKETAFEIVGKNDKAYIRSDKRYNSTGYAIGFDALLKGNTLEVIVKDVSDPAFGSVLTAIMPAIGYLFKKYVNSPQIDYDAATRTISGSPGDKLEIILKDDYENVGKEDRYECIL